MPRFVRPFLAALLTLTVLFGAGAANASPMPHDSGMVAAASMPCGEHAVPSHDMPGHKMPSHNMPCGHECCLGVLGCAALASGPVSMIPAAFSVPSSHWLQERHPDGLALKPALPPPIV